MIFRQLFDKTSSTYTYLLAERTGGEALLIDPVLENTDQYVRLIEELDLKLVKAVDTHIHADHVTALGALRERTGCLTAMGAIVDEVSEVMDIAAANIEPAPQLGTGLDTEFILGLAKSEDSVTILLDTVMSLSPTEAAMVAAMPGAAPVDGASSEK